MASLIGEELPHPVGSMQNQIVRDRIQNYLREFEYDPDVHRKELDDGTVVENVLARFDSEASESSIALVAHYDSVTDGPGASDDGVGVAAILEIARMLKSASRAPNNDVIFLLSDGEEYGMLGTEAFLTDHPWAGDIDVVINLDARGTSGPSLMFETSDDNAWLIDVLAQSLSRPVTSSVFEEVYKHLPNYTDFNSFRDRGVAGFNFAFIRNAQDQHTSRDDLDHVTPGSLQHHGDNAWQLTRELMNMDLTEKPVSTRAVYTDVFAWIVLWWSEATGRLWAIVMLVVLGGLLICGRGAFDAAHVVYGVTACSLILVLTFTAGWLLDLYFRRSGSFELPWSIWGAVAIGTFWGAMVAVYLSLAWLLPRHDTWTSWFTVWTTWSMIAVVASWLFPGVSYLLLLPLTGSVFSAVFTLLANRSDHPTSVMPAWVGTTTTACIWLPQQIILYDAVGLQFGIVYVLAITVLLATALPLIVEQASR